MAITA